MNELSSKVLREYISMQMIAIARVIVIVILIGGDCEDTHDDNHNNNNNNNNNNDKKDFRNDRQHRKCMNQPYNLGNLLINRFYVVLQIFFSFHPYLGKIPILTKKIQMGWTFLYQ